MRQGDTIAAVASARANPGAAHAGARAIVRLSGPDTRAALTALSREPFAFERGARRLRLALGTATLPVLAALYEAPSSYTGEDAADLLLVGSPFVVERLLAALCAVEGVRPAEAGEFTARAFLGGRITLDAAEGVAASIAATSDRERRAADLLLRGATGREMRSWADAIAGALALVEAGIDFTDQEDVVPIGAGDLATRLAPVAAAMRERAGGAAAFERSGAAPRVALVGPPNAGKSTLFNALLGRTRALVSDRAGTTRDAIVEPCDLTRFSATLPGGAPATVDLVDLAGLDAALATRSPVDALAQSAAAREIERACVLVWCNPAGRFERASPGLTLPPGAAIVRVRTKADRPPCGDDAGALGVCAIDGFNLGSLARAIVDAAFADARTESDLIPRHAHAAARAHDAVSAAIALARRNADPHALDAPEEIADALRSALDALGEVVGDITPDDVLGRIFSSFCVGK